jgi:DNA-binding NtrC family response regulator
MRGRKNMSGHIEGHILIVDDQQNWRDVLSALLQSQHTVQTASSFEEAKQAIVELTFDVAILDVRLIDQDRFNVEGLNLLKMIKETKPGTGVVILTGYPGSVKKGIVDEYKADKFVFKVPAGRTFDSAGFRSLIQELVIKYRGTDDQIEPD